MERRTFVSTTGIGVLFAGCSTRLTTGIDSVSVEGADNGWSQYRGTMQRTGQTNHRNLLGETNETTQIGYETGVIPVVAGEEVIIAETDGLRIAEPESLGEASKIDLPFQPVLTPAATPDLVVICGTDVASAYDISSGEEMWSVSRSPTFLPQSSPIAFGSHVLIAGGDRIRLLDKEGKKAWEYRIDAGLTGVASDTNRAIVSTYDGNATTIHAIDVSTGDQSWEYSGISGKTTIAVVEDEVYAVTEYGKLHRFQNGEKITTVKTGTSGRCGLSLGESVAIVGPDISGRFSAISSKTGEILWKRRFQAASFPVLSDNRCLISVQNEGLFSMGLTDGEIKKRVSSTLLNRLVPINNGLVAVHNPDNRVYIIR